MPRLIKALAFSAVARLNIAESPSVKLLMQAPVKNTWLLVEPAVLNVVNFVGTEIGEPLIVKRIEYCVLAVKPPTCNITVLSRVESVAPAADATMLPNGMELLNKTVNGVAADVRTKILHEVSVTPPTIGP